VTPSVDRTDIAFPGDAGQLRGWSYMPRAVAGAAPVVVMAAGFSLVKEQYLDSYAAAFAAAGMAVVVFDFRNLGESDGEPRQEINPWHQIEDYRHAITFASSLHGVDPRRIGVWGSSYSGGHVLVVGATDARVKAVVSQVPTISGHLTGLRRASGERLRALQRILADDRVGRMNAGSPGMRAIVGESGADVIYPAGEVREFFTTAAALAPRWRNEVTLRTLEWSRGYEPGAHVRFVSPAALLMIVAFEDDVIGTDLQLGAYERALHPKKLVMLPGGHFSPYREGHHTAVAEARDWFVRTL
jgi:fermentation-respiration switch protein FrsA (DUF1100 family)